MALNYQGMVKQVREWLRKDERKVERLPFRVPPSVFISLYAGDGRLFRLYAGGASRMIAPFRTVPALPLPPSGFDWELTDNFEADPQGYRVVNKEESKC